MSTIILIIFFVQRVDISSRVWYYIKEMKTYELQLFLPNVLTLTSNCGIMVVY